MQRVYKLFVLSGVMIAALAVAGLVAGCGFQPLYGRNPSVDDKSVSDRFAEVLVAPIPKRQGSPQARVAVAIQKALEFDLNNGAPPVTPTHRLEVVVTPSDITLYTDPVTGRAQEGMGGLTANYQLVEIATAKIALKDSTFARVGRDRSNASPGSALSSMRKTVPPMSPPKRSATGSLRISSLVPKSQKADRSAAPRLWSAAWRPIASRADYAKQIEI